MDGVGNARQDGDSDYGSDFSPEEERILTNLLQQYTLPEQHTGDLAPNGVEDDENPRGAKVPSQSSSQRSQRASRRSKPVYRRVSFDLKEDGSANGTYSLDQWPWI